MTSFLSGRVIPAYLRLTRANRPYASRSAAERNMAQLALRPRPFGPPRRLRRDVRVSVGRHGGWPVYTLTPTRQEPQGALVYAHGGGWVHEIAPQHFRLAAELAATAGIRVVLPIYPLVPHATAQAVVDGFIDIYLATTRSHGITCLAGDSAGGQIAMSTRLLLRDRGEPDPGHTILISPALDLSMTNPEMDRVQPRDPWLAKDGTRVYIDHWRADLPLADPRVSPLAADPTGTGPITLFIADRDILHPDALRFAELCTAADVDIRVHEAPGCVHVHPLTATAEGRRARRQMADVLRRAVRSGVTPEVTADGP